MKRIYLFVLSALMMLMSTSAMAQSETVKGEVNGDGVVDVADIAAVIKIMTENGDIQKKYYWYVGQEAVTADNYTTLNGVTQVTSYPTKYEYTPSKRGYVYILIANDKTVSHVEDKVSGGTGTVSEMTSVSISGYKVYKTGAAWSGPLYVHIK